MGMAEIQQIAREDLSKIELKNTTQSQRSYCNRQVVCSYLGTNGKQHAPAAQWPYLGYRWLSTATFL